MTTSTESIKMARLLDRQMNLWEIRRRLAAEGGEPARRELAHLDQGPWITLSKQLGTEWDALADRLAADLGWQVFDREILEGIARHSQAREAVISRLDEREVGWFEDSLARLLAPDDPGRAGFLGELARIIWGLARQGRTILVGRGANWLLDPRYGLRVRVVGSLDARAAAVAAQQGIPAERALRAVQEDDAARAGFVRQAYRRNIDDATGYDLILNLESLGVEAAAAAVTAALRRRLGA